MTVRPERPPPPRKRLGQHFLHDERVLDALVEALGPLTGRTVVEIGPGRGALTDRLVARLAADGGRLVAIELDTKLVALLRTRFADAPHVTIHHADVLDVDLAELAGGPYVLAGNVPYYITTPILFHALATPRPDVAVYLVQREVAERVVAPPGSEAYGALSVNVQAVADATLLRTVGKGAFTPPPTVESAVLRIVPRAEPVIEPALEAAMRAFVIACFGARRKQMQRVLRIVADVDAESARAVCDEARVAPDQRPEVLTVAAFARLTRVLIARGALGTRVADAPDPTSA